MARPNMAQSEETKLALLDQHMAQIDKNVEEIKTLMSGLSTKMETNVSDISKDFKANYVTKDEFAFIKYIVYAIIGAITTGLVGLLFTFLKN